MISQHVFLMPLTPFLQLVFLFHALAPYRMRVLKESRQAFFLGLVVVSLCLQHQAARYAFPFNVLPTLIVVLAFFRLLAPVPRWYVVERRTYLSRTVNVLLLAAVLAGLDYEYATTPTATVNLRSPYEGGVHVVAAGGSLINPHRVRHDQRWAIDIMTPLGWRDYMGAWNGSPEMFASFGEPVLAPCSGMIVEAVDGLADQRVGAMDERRPAGNHVFIACSHEKKSPFAWLTSSVGPCEYAKATQSSAGSR